MVVRFVVFIGLILSVLFGCHYLVYTSIVRLFALQGSGLKLGLSIAFPVLSVSFVASFFLLFWQENRLTVGFYILAATWIGLLINLLLAVGLSWLVIAISRWLHLDFNRSIVGTVVFSLAVLYSVYGFWKAFNPRIETVEVEIEHLPVQWKNKVIVHLSDLHLGHIHRLDFLERVLRKVDAQEPDLVLITGDLFDGMSRKFSHFADLLNTLKAKKGVYFVTGNHEHYVGLENALRTVRKTGMTVLHNEAVTVDGLQLIGISYPGVDAAEDIRNLHPKVGKEPGKMPKILLFHTPTNMSLKRENGLEQHFSTYWTPDVSFALNKEIGTDLQLSGHTHAGQIFPFTWLTKLIYRGYEYGLHREGDFSIYITSGVGTWGPPFRTGNWGEIAVIKLKQTSIAMKTHNPSVNRPPFAARR
ncbi:MAG: metallophosphoesterase [Proteobacteria bacterium]|nr:metallophosphoesterase [Pseudomonadota bacterium]